MSRPRLGDLTGAFGDVGTFLPLAAGLVLVVGVDAARSPARSSMPSSTTKGSR